MRVVVQRVSQASVRVDGSCVGEIGQGLLLLVGFGRVDEEQSAENTRLHTMARKVVSLRIFTNTDGRFDHSVIDIAGSILIIPQFTLYADINKGRRPDFFGALPPDSAQKMFDFFVKAVETELGKPVATGIFGADMKVSLVNDGPVTILAEL